MLRWWCGCWRADPTVAVAPPDPSPRQCQWNLLHPRCTHGSSPVVAVIRTAPTVNIGDHLSGIPFAGAWQFPRTTIREIKILKSLRHNNLVRLREIVTSTPSITKPKHEDKAGSIFLVFEYLPYDLAALVESPMKYVTRGGLWQDDSCRGVHFSLLVTRLARLVSPDALLRPRYFRLPLVTCLCAVGVTVVPSPGCRGHGARLEVDHVRAFAYQLLKALDYMHSNKVVHRYVNAGQRACVSYPTPLSSCCHGWQRGCAAVWRERGGG